MVGFYYGVLMVLVFFFKQKTAYDMRISDWSSDVCSSDLDPTSAFGGIIAFNRELDADTAKLIVERQFVEVIIAPRISAAARQIVAAKQNVRLLECGELPATRSAALAVKRVAGGMMVPDVARPVEGRGGKGVVSTGRFRLVSCH